MHDVMEREVNKRIGNFKYKLNGIPLEFNLRTDVKIELKAFREMLLMALKDVDEEIEK